MDERVSPLLPSTTQLRTHELTRPLTLVSYIWFNHVDKGCPGVYSNEDSRVGIGMFFLAKAASSGDLQRKPARLI